MQLIKDNQIQDNAWQFIADDGELCDSDITVTSVRLNQDGSALVNRQGKLGVRITPDSSVLEIVEFMPKLSLIELYFPELADGRLFSHAWLIRNRYGYKGELRACGHFLPDQVFYLSRVGVNSFCPENQEHLADISAGLRDFSVRYQPSTN